MEFSVIHSFLVRCASPIYVNEHAKNWIARPLSELKQAMKSPDSYASKSGWKETTYPLAMGIPCMSNLSARIVLYTLGNKSERYNYSLPCRREAVVSRSRGPDSFIRTLTPPPQ